jgi:hypothetical protein
MGQAARADLMRKNKELGEAFLSENKKKEGVITLDSGLQYKIIKTGEGNKPAASDTVVCHYRGTFIDGKEFDSSYRRRQPMIFPVAKAIKGWREALGLMPAGSQWQLFIPPDLAYGARGAGRKIGPEETLIFDVELIAIKDSAAAGASTAQTSLASAVISDIRISFKLDPRLSGATYGGEHWVSPPKYVGANAQDKVEAQAQGVNAKGAPAKINPEWISSDPEMVTVSPIQGDRVTITVKHAGESKVKVAVPGFSKEFVIKAKYQGQFIQIEIAQPVAEKSPGIAVAQGVPTNDVTQKEK